MIFLFGTDLVVNDINNINVNKNRKTLLTKEMYGDVDRNGDICYIGFEWNLTNMIKNIII